MVGVKIKLRFFPIVFCGIINCISLCDNENVRISVSLTSCVREGESIITVRLADAFSGDKL